MILEPKMARKFIYFSIEKNIGKIPLGFKGVLSKLLKDYVKIHHRHLTNTNNELLIIINKKNIVIDNLRKNEARGLHNQINDNKKKFIAK